MYEFTDQVSLTYDTTNQVAASSTAGVSICGPRSYSFSPSLAGTDWLSFDQNSNGLITVAATLATPVNYAESSPGSGRFGYEVVVTGILTNYPTISAAATFYVKITECVITSFTMDPASGM